MAIIRIAGPESLEFTAPAKINLALKVLGRRPDGYHELDMVLARLTLADRLRLTWADGPDEDRLEARTGPGLRAPLPPGFSGPDNLALRALQAFRARAGWPRRGVRLSLEKNIPWGAGLGGGSADGAAVLAALNRAAPRPLPDPELAALALALGADLPFCLSGAALARARGVGEILSPPPPSFEPFRGRRLLLVKPDFSLSTAAVFQKLGLTKPPPDNTLNGFDQGGQGGPAQSGLVQDGLAQDGLEPGVNDLLPAALRLAPALAEAAAAVSALRPRAWGLSGSGPTFWLEGPGLTEAGLSEAALVRAGFPPAWWVGAAAVAA